MSDITTCDYIQWNWNKVYGMVCHSSSNIPKFQKRKHSAMSNTKAHCTPQLIAYNYLTHTNKLLFVRCDAYVLKLMRNCLSVFNKWCAPQWLPLKRMFSHAHLPDNSRRLPALRVYSRAFNWCALTPWLNEVVRYPCARIISAFAGHFIFSSIVCWTSGRMWTERVPKLRRQYSILYLVIN